MGCYFGLESEKDCRSTPCRSCTANEPDNVEIFVTEYSELCRRTGLSTGVSADGTLGVFRLDCEDNEAELDRTIARWLDDMRQCPG